MQKPPSTLGLRHVALQVRELEKAVSFYTDLLGMRIEWQPDPDNVYLTSGVDNLALHRIQDNFAEKTQQRLDHIGFILKTPEDVDTWHDYFLAHNVTIMQAPKTHRDGARSFYCTDPDGNIVQMIYHPPLVTTA